MRLFRLPAAPLSTFLTLTLLGGLAAATSLNYQVQSGDTLYSVARSHGTSAAEVLRLNGLQTSTLNVGQMLRLPAGRGQVAAAQGVAAQDVPLRSTPVRTQVRPAGLPNPDSGLAVRGPVAWTVAPQPTVASFIGYLPVVATAAFGDLLPIRTYLQGLAFDYQTYNNCGPSALSSVLGFYKANVGQDAIRLATRRDGGYMHTSAIAPELARFNLKTLTIRGGRLDQVKRLLSMGIPVIVLQWYDRPGHINHFRVVRGYDDQAGVMWVSDSMVGPLAYLSYRDFDALWNTQDRQMFPVYPNGFDARVRALL